MKLAANLHKQEVVIEKEWEVWNKTLTWPHWGHPCPLVTRGQLLKGWSPKEDPPCIATWVQSVDLGWPYCGGVPM